MGQQTTAPIKHNPLIFHNQRQDNDIPKKDRSYSEKYAVKQVNGLAHKVSQEGPTGASVS